MTIDERLEFLTQSIESHDRQLGELTDKMAKTDERIRTVLLMTENNATAIGSLIAAMQAHEQRISDLEGLQ